MSSQIAGKRTRKRTLEALQPPVTGTQTQFYIGESDTIYKMGGSSLNGFETTTDELHPWWVSYQKSRRAGYNNPGWLARFGRIFRTGGEFRSHKVRFNPGSCRRVNQTWRNTFGGATYLGWVSPVDPAVIKTSPSPIEDSVLRDWGAKQLLENRPMQPIVGIAQTLAELKREGLPRLSRLKRVEGNFLGRDTGTSYLPFEFGIKPIVQDVYALADSIDTAAKQWDKLVREANNLETRRVRLPTMTSTTTSVVKGMGNSYPSIHSGVLSGQNADLHLTRTISTKRTFSAGYTYYIPPFADSDLELVREAQRLRTQYGLTVNPSLIWELTPWSWLIDWFVPIGDFLEALDSLILGNNAVAYGYVSDHTVVNETYTRPGAVFKDGTGVGYLSVTHDYKRRVEAHPLGFGVTWEGLSPKQISILAAVGISRK